MKPDELVLFGNPMSPNVRAARLAFAERRVPLKFHEIGFDHLATVEYGAINPFRKMPALKVGDATYFETPSLMVIADSMGSGPSLEPDDALARAHMWKLVGVAQNYLYTHAIMKFFFHRAVAPLLGVPADAAIAADGARATRDHLSFIEQSLRGRYLAGDALSFADLYCGAMLEPLLLLRDGRAMFDATPKARAWISALAERASFRDTAATPLVARREA